VLRKQNRSINKETHLLAAAGRVVYKRGVMQTTLSDIADEAGVPLGSIYYYFKSKDDIITAIVGDRISFVNDRLKAIEQQQDGPKERLKALVHVWVEDRDTDARYGCPVGSLCYELCKGRGRLSEKASEPLRLLIDWSAVQFREAGHTRAQARELGTHLNVVLQGISLVANAYGAPKLIDSEACRLCKWIDDL